MYEDLKKAVDNTSCDLLKNPLNITHSIKIFEEAMLNCMACFEKNYSNTTLHTENLKDDTVEDISSTAKIHTDEKLNNKNTSLAIACPEDSPDISELHSNSLPLNEDLSGNAENLNHAHENLINKNHSNNNLVLEKNLDFEEGTITKESIDFNENLCSKESCTYKEPSNLYTSLTTEEKLAFEENPAPLKRTIKIVPVPNKSFSKNIFPSSHKVSSNAFIENKEIKKSINAVTPPNNTNDLACLNKENLKRNQIVDFINNNFRGVNLTIYTSGAQKISGEVVFNYDYLVTLKDDSITYYINPKEIAYFY